MRPLITATLFLIAATPAPAQDLLGSYFTMIGPKDFRDASGTPLSDPCAILQQDRENFHHFGLRDAEDHDDAFFAEEELRGIIGQDCRLQHPAQIHVADALRAGRQKYLIVLIYGSDGRPEFVTFAGRRRQSDGDTWPRR